MDDEPQETSTETWERTIALTMSQLSIMSNQWRRDVVSILQQRENRKAQATGAWGAFILGLMAGTCLATTLFYAAMP
jgi:hypothetical protein